MRDVVHAILLLHQTKVPFRRIDMAKTVQLKKLPDEVLHAAKRHLKQVFGLRLMQVTGNETHYLLVKVNKRPVFAQRVRETDVHDCILIFVLTVIFMTAETGCPAEKVSEFLTLIGMDDEADVWTGRETMKVKELLSREWVKQLYLEKFENEDILTKRSETTIGWGFRAKQEFEAKDMLNLVAAVTGTPGDLWREQFSRAHDEDDAAPDAVSLVQQSTDSQTRRTGGRTQRLVVDLTRLTRPIARRILSESNRINHLPAPHSRPRL